ncbi:ATP-grasp domain-containing protein [Ignatzschineria cameli]|uniref:ATP-grasp domain-containing protein n=1 Tax=Ignatzschineria cameli TaxID=2182793 RepID=A0A2U2AKR6_9GAMM|nr:hypothetical protein [Ignatzschineria cameli]PWD83465.1 hypothetical protein DC077_09660 [Ignatzschineria cameli]PWD88458.1 hypothetical protein DC079_09375 [Ignatzschineria cameli]PWD89064.1 hypothetical protein DC081_09630 [Ignatzschineria cameli]PWD89723.1 hypothetical protein DC078_09405 [Ignatzschineria cameli]
MDQKLNVALNSLLEKSVKNRDYREAFEVGSYLLQQKVLVEKNLKWLMTAAMHTGNRKTLLDLFLDKEKNEGLISLEKGFVASLFYQLKDEEKCSEYALQYSKENVISKSREGKLKVLILQTFASGSFNFNSKSRSFHMPDGHNNLMSVLDRDIQKIILRVDDIDVALKELKRQNISVDIIYNSITDPERCEVALCKAAAICTAFPNVPVINHPSDILATSRDNNYTRFNNIPNIVYPKNIRLENISKNCHSLIREAIEKHQFQFPLIVRLSGYQGGKNMYLIESIEQHDFTDFETIVSQTPKDIYLIEYIDVSFKDDRLPDVSLFPKYRAFFVAGKLYPIHLFIAGNDFNVHLGNSETLMKENPWLIEIEKQFCDSPEAVVGELNWSAIETLLQKSGLDYVGIDFALSQDIDRPGVVIFEINAAMRNWMKSDRALKHVRVAWEKVTRRMHIFMCDQAKIPTWSFALS